MNQTPKGLRLHIGLFGRRNAGKSSLVNALTGQSIAIVSDVPGTTTDPVEKACELAPIGPVVFIDTTGIDDVGELGAARTRRSLAVLDWMDIVVVVCDADGPAEHEEGLIATAQSLGTPVLAEQLYAGAIAVAGRGGAERFAGWMPDSPAAREYFELVPRRTEITMIKPLAAGFSLDDELVASTDRLCEVDHV